MYLALVESIIQYGIIGWGGTTKSALTPLILLQKRIIKICLKKNMEYPTNLIFSELKVFTIDQIYNYYLLKFYHKNRNKFTAYPHNYSTRRNNTLTLVEPKCFTSAGLLHGTSLGPRLYNSKIKLQPKLATYSNTIFKHKIKKFI